MSETLFSKIFLIFFYDLTALGMERRRAPGRLESESTVKAGHGR